MRSKTEAHDHEAREARTGGLELSLRRGAGLAWPGAPDAKLLGRYVPVRAQIQQALLLGIDLGDPPEPGCLVFSRGGPPLTLYHPFQAPREGRRISKDLAHETPDPLPGLKATAIWKPVFCNLIHPYQMLWRPLLSGGQQSGSGALHRLVGCEILHPDFGESSFYEVG